MLEALDGAQAVVEFDAIGVRQVVVQDKQVRFHPLDDVEGARTIGDEYSAMRGFLRNSFDKKIAQRGLVFHHEDRFHVFAPVVWCMLFIVKHWLLRWNYRLSFV